MCLAILESRQEPNVDDIVGRAEQDIARRTTGEHQIFAACETDQVAGVGEEVSSSSCIAQTRRVCNFKVNFTFNSSRNLHIASKHNTVSALATTGPHKTQNTLEKSCSHPWTLDLEWQSVRYIKRDQINVGLLA